MSGAALIAVMLGVHPVFAAAAPAPPMADSGGLAGVAIRRVRTALPVVALTFDACATRGRAFGFDRRVFEILRRDNVPATVFLSGRWIKMHPQAARELAALPQVEFGNHAFSHPPFSKLPRSQAGREIDGTDDLIRDLGKTSIGFRPPYGDWSRSLLGVMRSRGRPVVLWDVVSGDAGGHLRPLTMVKKVMREIRPGSIVIFHINGRGPFTHKALPAILTQLKERGLRPIRVSELLHLPDAEPEPARPDRYERRKGEAPPKGAAPATAPSGREARHEVRHEARPEGRRDEDAEFPEAPDAPAFR